MKKRSDGSVLLLVLGVTSTVMILSLAMWHSMSLMVDLVSERERFYKNFYKTETILHVGLTAVRANFDTLMSAARKHEMPLMLAITAPTAFFEPGITARCVVDWHDQLQNDALLVKALVYDHQRIACALSCVCVRIKAQQNAKSNITSIDGEGGAQQRSCFVVRNFTIGVV